MQRVSVAGLVAHGKGDDERSRRRELDADEARVNVEAGFNGRVALEGTSLYAVPCGQ